MFVSYNLNTGKRTEIYSTEEIVSILKDNLDYKDEKIQTLSDKVKKLEDKHWKDDTLLKLKLEIAHLKENLDYGFHMTSEENEAVNKWKKEHITNQHNGNNYAGAIGGSFQYRFVPTSIGVIGTIVCTSCIHSINKRTDLTEEEKRDMIISDASYCFRNLT